MVFFDDTADFVKRVARFSDFFVGLVGLAHSPTNDLTLSSVVLGGHED